MTGLVVGLLGDRVGRSSTWSGSPSGLQRGLVELGIDVVTVDTHLPRAANALGRVWVRSGLTSRRIWERTPEAIRARQVWGRTLARRWRTVDGWIQIGSESGMPLRPSTYVTFDDMAVAQARRLPNAYFERIDDLSFARWEEVQRHLTHSARAVCVASHWAARSFVEDLGVPVERVKVVGIGANLTVEPHPKPWDPPQFLFVGLDWERKNGPAVLRAFRRLREETPRARLDLVGGHPRVDAEGVTGHGPLSQDVPTERKRLIDLFARSTCLVVPSLSEPFGIVYLEAATAGVASIGTTVGGSSEPIGDTGILVEPTDPAGILAAMRHMADPEIASERGRAAARRAELFTWKRVAARTVRALGLRGTGLDEAYLEPS